MFGTQQTSDVGAAAAVWVPVCSCECHICSGASSLSRMFQTIQIGVSASSSPSQSQPKCDTRPVMFTHIRTACHLRRPQRQRSQNIKSSYFFFKTDVTEAGFIWKWCCDVSLCLGPGGAAPALPDELHPASWLAAIESSGVPVGRGGGRGESLGFRF